MLKPPCKITQIITFLLKSELIFYLTQWVSEWGIGLNIYRILYSSFVNTFYILLFSLSSCRLVLQVWSFFLKFLLLWLLFHELLGRPHLPPSYLDHTRQERWNLARAIAMLANSKHDYSCHSRFFYSRFPHVWGFHLLISFLGWP